MTRDRRWTWLGIAYGCALLVFGVGSAGMGHCSYLPLAISAAPVSIVPVVGILLAPVWWGAVGMMLTARWRGTAVSMMVLHTCAVGLILWLGTPDEPGSQQWEYFAETQRSMPIWLWSGAVVYVFGQAVAWMAAVAKAGGYAATST